MTIAAILKHKGAEVAHVSASATIAEVAGELAARKIGAVLVMDQAGALLGILSERDIVATLAQHGARTLDMSAAQLMTAELHTATPRTTVQEAMEIMTVGRFRHLPVVDDGHLAGIVSIGDIVKARLRDQAQEVDSLMAYVAGAG